MGQLKMLVSERVRGDKNDIWLPGSELDTHNEKQARSYVQARGGSCLLVPRRLN